jgi:hypothetical protein
LARRIRLEPAGTLRATMVSAAEGEATAKKISERRKRRKVLTMFT